MSRSEEQGHSDDEGLSVAAKRLCDLLGGDLLVVGSTADDKHLVIEQAVTLIEGAGTRTTPCGFGFNCRDRASCKQLRNE